MMMKDHFALRIYSSQSNSSFAAHLKSLLASKLTELEHPDLLRNLIASYPVEATFVTTFVLCLHL